MISILFFPAKIFFIDLFLGLVNYGAMARMTVGEMLTNIVWAPLTALEHIKCSGKIIKIFQEISSKKFILRYFSIFFFFLFLFLILKSLN